MSSFEPNLLEGVANFRDIGGYRTIDGSRVRYGRVFRSSSLISLNEADRLVLARLNIQTVCDLRTVAEVARDPADWSSLALHIVASSKADTQAMLAPMVALGNAPIETWHREFSTFYSRLPEIYADEYRSVFNALAQNALPLLINCSAGKDRTGVLCAFLLASLGVPMETVIEDYLASEVRLKNDNGFTRMLSRDVVSGFDRLPNYAQELLLSVNEDALLTAFLTVNSHYGSLQGYLETRLGITERAQSAIKDFLLEPPMAE